MPSLTEDELRDLSHAIALVLDARAPGWTARPSSDPGITLLQVMAYAAEAIAYRQPTPETGSLAALVRQRLLAWAASSEAGDLRRVRYFGGQLLTDRDFQDEQTYHRDMRRRLLRCLVGSGVVTGLEVGADDATAGAVDVTIGPGCAVTSSGELLVIDRCTTCRVTPEGPTVYVALCHLERDVDPVLAHDPPTLEATRVEERTAIECAAAVPGDGVAIGRLTRSNGTWTVDPTFVPARVTRLPPV